MPQNGLQSKVGKKWMQNSNFLSSITYLWKFTRSEHHLYGDRHSLTLLTPILTPWPHFLHFNPKNYPLDSHIACISLVKYEKKRCAHRYARGTIPRARTTCFSQPLNSLLLSVEKNIYFFNLCMNVDMLIPDVSSVLYHLYLLISVHLIDLNFCINLISVNLC